MSAPHPTLRVVAHPRGGPATIAVQPGGASYLVLTSLISGIGSSGLRLDRGQPGDVRLVSFDHDGAVVYLRQHNKHFTVTGEDEAALAAGAASFASSIIWSTPLLDTLPGGEIVVDASSFALLDLVRVAPSLSASGQGELRLDPGRSFVSDVHTATGQAGTAPSLEISATVTFAGRITGSQLTEVSPDLDAVSVTQRVSLIPAPHGFERLPYDPRTGGYGKGFHDHNVVIGESVTALHQPRFRLEKTVAGPAPSSVLHPITFYVDPAIPEPIRSAVIEGGRWWRDAFAAAGFLDAFDVRVRPADIDPFDAHISSVWWVHRTGRGWSQGAAITDPRTGEILKGQVRLGSQRVHQLSIIAQALLAPYGATDEAQRLAAVEALVLGRIRQLAAHEIGHALGLMHNYASNAHPQQSVMDYPHPQLRLNSDGSIDTSTAYPSGLGPWDVLAIARIYGPPDGPGRAPRTVAHAGAALAYLTDADGHGNDAASPDAVPWTSGADALTSLAQTLRVRDAALRAFSPAVAPPGEQAGAIEERLVPVQLLHRYQTVAVARLLGGERYSYAVAGDAALGTRTVAAPEQHAALAALVALFDPAILTVPDHILAILTPPPIRYQRTAEYLAPLSGPVFDPLAAAAATASLPAEQLFASGRLNRLTWQHAIDPAIPAVGHVVTTVLDAVWQVPSGDATARPLAAQHRAVRLTAAWVVLRSAAAAATATDLHPQVAAIVRAAIATAAATLAESANAAGDLEWAQFAATASRVASDPGGVDLGPAPHVPPGAPI